jgi:hypothetical protein
MNRRRADIGIAQPRPSTGARVPAWVISVLSLGGGTYVVLFAIAIANTNGELLQALTIAPLLVLFTVPIALRIARTERDRALASIVMAGLVAKLLAGLVRYYVAYVGYHGATDASQYDLAGRTLAPHFRSFVFTADIGRIVGTGFTKLIAGGVYAIFGVSRIGGFLVFAWIGFLGLLLFARAFRLGVPEGDGRRYLILVLFWPSLLYWPSAIGKEAWMMLAIGLTVYGIAGLFRRRSAGLVAFALGVFGMLMVRPHVALIVFVGAVFALLVRRAPARSYAAPLARVVALAALLVLGVFLAGRTASFLGQESLTAESVSIELSNAEQQTADGGSKFTPVHVNTPFDMVPAFATVYFRPFLVEAGSLQGYLTAAEGMTLLLLFIGARKRLRNIPRLMRTTPYVGFSAGYVVAFVYAFSSFANFGILTRQRVQALPLLFVFLAIPSWQATDPPPVASEASGARPLRQTASVTSSRPRRPPRRRADPRRSGGAGSVGPRASW